MTSHRDDSRENAEGFSTWSGASEESSVFEELLGRKRKERVSNGERKGGRRREGNEPSLESYPREEQLEKRELMVDRESKI